MKHTRDMIACLRGWDFYKGLSRGVDANLDTSMGAPCLYLKTGDPFHTALWYIWEKAPRTYPLPYLGEVSLPNMGLFY